MGRMDLTKIKFSLYKLVFFTVLLVLESYFIYDIERFNLNFLFMAVFVSFYLVVSLLRLPNMVSFKKGIRLRNISKYLYLIHPAIILGLDILGVKQYSALIFGILSVVVSLVISYIMVEKKVAL